MGLSWQQISRWERGGRTPNLYNAIGLAVATQRLVEDLFLDYRRDWQERIGEKAKLLSAVDKKVENSKNKTHA